MEMQIRPDDDFYQWVNGDWIQKHPVPPDRSVYGAFTELQEAAESNLRSIIESAAVTPVTDPDGVIRKIGDFYRSGMDTERIENAGISPVREDLERISSLATPKDIQSLIAYFVTCGINPLFSLSAETDPKDSTAMIAGLSQEGLGLPNKNYYSLDDTESVNLRTDYQNHIGTMFGLSGDLPDDATQNAHTVMRIETRLAAASYAPEENRDPLLTYHKMSVAELETLSPNFNWTAFLATIGYPGISELNVHQPRFFGELDSLISTVPLTEWKVFLRWKLITGIAPYLDSRFEQENFAFYGKRLNGQKEMKPRWKRIVAATGYALGDAIGQLYVEKHFPPASKQKMEVLVGNLKEALCRRIEQITWMDPPTRKEALEKLQSMQFKIGYPEEWRDFRGLVVSPEGYAQNVLRASQFDFRCGPLGLDKVGKPVDRRAWFMTPQTVNAYYEPAMNEIVFPAAILQPPFFDREGDDATNYGAIGAVIGHEMTHGFDDMGRKYDKDGNLRDWWTESSAAEYTRRVQLLIDQYNAFEVLPGLFSNGTLTLGENIADFGGITIAYHAFMGVRQRNELHNQGDVADHRRFFIGFTRIWRESIRNEALRNSVLSDVHAPARFRVNGTLFNMPEFYAAFPEITSENRYYRSPDQRPVIW
jgi:putative endopeptidase